MFNIEHRTPNAEHRKLNAGHRVPTPDAGHQKPEAERRMLNPGHRLVIANYLLMNVFRKYSSGFSFLCI
jgi:hypothetical protein